MILPCAILTCGLDIIKLLFSASTEKPSPAFLNATNEAGNTPLHWAALNGQLESVKLLVQAGVDVTIINRAGHDAVYEAEINDKNEVVDWLLGAVEELEKGIGHTGESTLGESTDAEADGINDDGAASNDTHAQGPSVENVRKQMEDLNTQDGAPKHG